jgi:hypothetical protein
MLSARVRVGVWGLKFEVYQLHTLPTPPPKNFTRGSVIAAKTQRGLLIGGERCSAELGTGAWPDRGCRPSARKEPNAAWCVESLSYGELDLIDARGAR